MADITEEALVSPLPGFALLSISGDDRHSFLHGQLINDLNLIKKPAAQLSAWCNPKGQVISNFIVINTGISYLLLFRDDLKDFVKKRLGMFIMRSDVSIKDISEQSPVFGLANINDLSFLGSNIPATASEIQVNDGLIIICHPDNSGRYLITGKNEELDSKVSVLISIQKADSAVWELLDILAGLPWITTRTQEQFLPQMLNLDALNSLSYQKGCFPGQEVIARLHYRGEVKKRLNLIKSLQPLSIGDNLVSEQSNSNAGIVINSATHSDNNCYALAVIESSKINDKLIINGEEIIILDLPYTIEQ